MSITLPVAHHWRRFLLVGLYAVTLAGCRSPVADPTPTLDSVSQPTRVPAATTLVPESGASLSTPPLADTATPPEPYPPPAATVVLPDAYPPPVETASPDAAYPPPFATSTPVVVPLPALPPGVLPSLDSTPAAGTCLPHDPTVTLQAADLWAGAGPELALEVFMNAGGAAEALPDLLVDATSPEPPLLVQVASYDLTADSVPEVLVALTRSYGGGNGETHLVLFRCQDGSYASEVLFRRAGAGGRAEGLYAGGGAVVESFQDLNGNGTADLLFAARWPHYAEYYLLEWDGAEFASLIVYTDLLGESKNRLEVVDGRLELSDPDGDGIPDLVVVEACSGGQAERKTFWRWDGSRFHHDGEAPPSPGC